MDCPEFLKLRKLAATEEALEATTAYMERNLRRFLKQQERVLICFPSHGRDKVSGIWKLRFAGREEFPYLEGRITGGRHF